MAAISGKSSRKVGSPPESCTLHGPNGEQPVELLFKVFQGRVGFVFVSCICKQKAQRKLQR